MKKTLLSLVALFLLGGVIISANAQEDEIIDFDATFYRQWSEVSGTAEDLGAGGGGMKLNETLDNGAALWGNLTGAVPYLYYANISDYTELRFEGTAGTVVRLMTNRLVNEGPIYEIRPTIGDDGKLTVLISDLKHLNGGAACDFACLQSIKLPNGGKITSIKIVKPGDPLSVPKTNLKNMINEAKKCTSYGKTTESWNTLQTAIQDGDAELTNATATEKSLNDATDVINAAINGLTLDVGYTNLTKQLFKQYASLSQPGEGANVDCAYDINKSTAQPYGDGSVSELKWADLTDYDKLIVVCSGNIKPRFCFNRLEAGGNQASTKEASKMIDINPNSGDTWSNEAYQTIEGKVYIIDLTAIVADYNFARLHCIKKQGWNDNVFVTDMLLYKEPTIKTSSAELQGYKTFYDAKNNYQVDANTTIYKATAVSKTSVSLQAVEGKIVPKGTPVILKTTNTTDYKISLTLTAEETTTDFSDNVLKAAAAETSNLYILAYTTEYGLGFFKYTDALTPGQVYVDVPAEAKGILMIDEEDEPTAISEVVSDEKEDGVAYNLAGQPVGDDYKGIVIKNGKKYLQK